jgi:capsular polysaccharide transport system permease protein
MRRSAFLCVGLPTLLAAIYYGIIASDQFVASGHMVIKSSSSSAGAGEGLALLGIISPASTMIDVLVVNKYITSKQMLTDLGVNLDVRALYSAPKIDWISRLKPDFGEDLIHEEDLHKYWASKVTVHFDPGTGISEFAVRAFNPEDAKKIADDILVLSEKLVNRLSARAKKDALDFAKLEVDDYRKKAIDALAALAAFQERVQQVNPEAFARARSEIEGSLEGELTKLETQLDLMRKNLPEAAPGIVLGKERTSVLAEKLAQERAKSTLSQGGGSAAQILSEFAKVKLETEFAAQAYISSLRSLEVARLQAQKQALFLEAFDKPQLPESAEYPHRFTNTLLVFVVSLLVWGIGGLLVAAVREHI